MKINFHIRYKTAPGQSLCAVAFIQAHPQPIRQVIVLKPEESGQWTAQADIPLSGNAVMTYAYYVMEGDKIIRREWNTLPRQLTLSADIETYQLYDWWRDLPAQSWLYSDVFAKEQKKQELPHFLSSVILHFYIPGLSDKQTPLLCGAIEALGNWKPAQAVPLIRLGANEWAAVLNADTLQLPAQYKIVLKNEDGSYQWELDSNRELSSYKPTEKECLVYTGLSPRFPSQVARKAGVVLPVFSIRTEADWGVGDFGSLKQLVDWAEQTGQTMIQLLPVNDTSLTNTWQDSYPYNSVSVYALHPMYVNPAALPALPDEEEEKFQTRRLELNQLPTVDYEKVTALKKERLQAAYQQEGKQVLASAAFKTFWNANAHWLPAYAMFCALRDKSLSSDWQDWLQYSQFSEQALREFFTKDSEEREQAYLYFYTQFVLHNQLAQVHQYARSKGISLKGDIPIGVSPHSADAWMNPDLFHLDTQAGAPPDDFSATGQNWGFPTYNWDKMAQDGYTWWKQRLAHMSNYFDAYRIDHVLGFFRIWEIPAHAVQGILGQFSPALPLTEQEIKDVGFDFNLNHTKPYITEDILRELFGEEIDFVRYTYFMPEEDGRYSLLPLYDTQRKIEQSFSDKQDVQSKQLQKVLYELCANVLFVPDHQDAQRYHPRIDAMKTTAFKALPPEQQQAYERLYNDYFFHRHDVFWKEQALKKLPALLQASSMLCCAEDLGMIPHCVPEVMSRLQMLSLEIQRMPKQLGHPFADTNNYPYLSVATPSTHDMSVLRGWWKENPQLTERFWHDVLGRTGATPEDAPADACEQILHAHLQSPSMLCLIAWQDWTSMDEQLRAPDPEQERINVPAEPKHYWRYRMHMTIEDLMQKTDFNEKIKQMIQESGR